MEFKYMNTILSIMAGIVMTVGGWLGISEAPNLGATPVSQVQQGGTGWGNIQSGTYLTGNGTGKLSTSTCAQITGSADLCDGSDASGGGTGVGTVSTSTGETAGNLAYWTSTNATPALLGKVATSSKTCTAPLSCTGFDVVGSGSGAITLDTTDLTNYGKAWEINAGGFLTPTTTLGVKITNTGAGDSFVVEDSASTDTTPFVITETGDVGIGTTSPGATLDVNGTARVWNQTGVTKFTIKTDSANQSTNSSFVITDVNGNPLIEGVDLGGGYQFSQGRSVGFYGNNLAMGSASGIKWSDYNNVLQAGSQDTGLSRGGVGKVYVGNGTIGDYTGTLIAGNVGIGTTTPSDNLTINGNGRIENQGQLKFSELRANGNQMATISATSSMAADLNFTLPAVDGTLGQALLTNGVGNLYFGTITTSNASSTLLGDNNTWTGTNNFGVVTGISLDEIENPATDKTFTMAANNLTFNFTTPSDGLTLNATGAFSDHVLHIHQTTGNPGAGAQGLHIQFEDPDPTGMTIDMMAASTSPALKILSGTTDLTGGLVSANNATSTLFSATTAWLTNLWIGVDTLAEYIADTAGAMFTGNTETGISITYDDTDNTIDAVCATANTSTFGCLSDTDWDTFNGKDNVVTAGDGLTRTADDIDFDGGTSPAGSLGGTWASPTIDDLFLLNNGDIGTGVFDFGGATSLEIPNGAPTIDTTGEIGIDTTSGQFKWSYNNGTSLGIEVPYKTMVSQYATSTWSGTTTVYMAPAMAALTVNGVYCDTSAGTLWMSLYDGTNRANLVQASTTQGYFAYSTNNTFTASEKIRVDYGTPASSPTQVSCRFKYTYDAD
jgi:hypothetical protein